MRPIDSRIRQLRIGLGEKIVRENDIAGTEDSVLSEAEMQALLLAVMDGKPDVTTEEVQAVVHQFEEAKATWYALRTMLARDVAIYLENGELRFRFREAGVAAPVPPGPPPFDGLLGIPPARGEG